MVMTNSDRPGRPSIVGSAVGDVVENPDADERHLHIDDTCAAERLPSLRPMCRTPVQVRDEIDFVHPQVAAADDVVDRVRACSRLHAMRNASSAGRPLEAGEAVERVNPALPS